MVQPEALSRARHTVLFVAGAILLAACGGGTPAATDGTSSSGGKASAQESHAASSAAPGDGDILTPDDISAAFGSLEDQGSWMFQAEVFTAAAGGNLSITGIERREPEQAVAAEHSTANGVFGYIRIGDDIWFDVATDTWTHADAGSAGNLIAQYEPLHLAGLVSFAGFTPSNEYEYVGDEEANGVPSRHYRLSLADREHTTQALGLTPDQWAGDVWIAIDGGYLVRYVWGPQSLDLLAATGGIGFSYDATDIGCSCPIEAPV